MGNTFKYTLLELIRMPGIMVWALGFPIILSTVFVMMFSPLEEMASVDSVAIVAVQPDDSPDGAAFKAFLEAVSDGDDPFLEITYVASASEAKERVEESQGDEDPLTGYVELVDGEPRTFVVGETDTSGMGNLASSLVVMAMDTYTTNRALFQRIALEDPSALGDPALIESLLEPLDATVQVEVTENQPKETVRFYFALLGMAALFGGTLGMVASQRLKPNTSSLGARRSLGSVSHGKTVAATLVASWCVTFACLVITFFYMKVAAHIEFGGREGLCLLVLAASSLMATALGCAVSAIPRLPETAKSGILTGIVCFAALFAGLYGQPTMELADQIARSCPAAEWINPAAQIAQSFYSIMYYDTLGPLFTHVGILLAMALILFGLSARSLRRHRYASL